MPGPLKRGVPFLARQGTVWERMKRRIWRVHIPSNPVPDKQIEDGSGTAVVLWPKVMSATPLALPGPEKLTDLGLPEKLNPSDKPCSVTRGRAQGGKCQGH